jgi:imidazolonepropionase-like amidohydrolase
VRAGTTVVVDGDRITAVGGDQAVKVPGGADVIDASGQTLIPGLWDMHQHLSDVDGVLDIAAGVTAVRDLGNERGALRRLVDGYATGTLVGPRVVRAGLVDGPGPYAIPGAVIVATPEEARRAVDDYAADGYEAIKIYGSMSPALVPVIAERAHAKGLRVGGHVPAHMIAADAVRDGYDEINHVPFLIMNFFGPMESANIPASTTAFAQHAALVDPRSDGVKQFIALLKAHRTVLDPTLYVFERSLLWRAGVFGPGYETVGERLPLQARRGLLKGGVPIPPGMAAQYQSAVPASARLIKAMHDAGVPVVAGSDFGIYGFALHRELELHVAAGISAPEVLQLATLGAARVVGQERELGSIAPGKLADLVLIDGDPTTRIADVRHPRLVVTRGRFYEPSKLTAALGILPQSPR